MENDKTTQIVSETINENIETLNYIDNLEDSNADYIMIVSHGTSNGIIWDNQILNFEEVSFKLETIQSKHIFFISCYSNNINDYLNSDSFYGFTGIVDAEFASLFVLQNMDIDVMELLNNRVNDLTNNPNLVNPLGWGDEDNTLGSDFLWSPNVFTSDPYFEVVYVAGTGNNYFYIAIDFRFTLDSNMHQWWDDNTNKKFSMYFKIKNKGHDEMIWAFGDDEDWDSFGGTRGYVGNWDNEICVFGIDCNEVPEMEYVLKEPQDKTIGSGWTADFRIYTDSKFGVSLPAAGNYEYYLYAYAEKTYENPLLYTPGWHDYDQLSSDTFTVSIPGAYGFTVSFPNWHFESHSQSAFNFDIDSSLDTYVDLQWIIKEEGSDPYGRYFRMYVDGVMKQSIVANINSGGQKSFSFDNIYVDKDGDTQITIVIYYGDYGSNYEMKSVTISGDYLTNGLTLYNYNFGSISEFI